MTCTGIVFLFSTISAVIGMIRVYLLVFATFLVVSNCYLMPTKRIFQRIRVNNAVSKEALEGEEIQGDPSINRMKSPFDENTLEVLKSSIKLLQKRMEEKKPLSKDESSWFMEAVDYILSDAQAKVA